MNIEQYLTAARAVGLQPMLCRGALFDPTSQRYSALGAMLKWVGVPDSILVEESVESEFLAKVLRREFGIGEQRDRKAMTFANDMVFWSAETRKKHALACLRGMYRRHNKNNPSANYGRVAS